MRTRFIWVGFVEVLNEFVRVREFIGSDPGCFFVGALVTSPAHKVQEFALAVPIYLCIKDFSYLEFNLTVDSTGSSGSSIRLGMALTSAGLSIDT